MLADTTDRYFLFLQPLSTSIAQAINGVGGEKRIGE
jgi:hypothetical protein